MNIFVFSSSSAVFQGVLPFLGSVHLQAELLVVELPLVGRVHGREDDGSDGGDEGGSRRSDGGTSWTGWQNLTSEARMQQYPSISIDNSNNLYVVWQGTTSWSTTNTQIRYRKYVNSNSTWIGLQNLTRTKNIPYTYPNLVWSNYPNVSGFKTNIPQAGFAFVFMAGSTANFYVSYATNNIIYCNSTDLTWDSTPPTSSVNAIAAPYWKKASTTITATASDTGGSGLKNVTLYYYNSSNNVTWYGPVKFGVNSTPWKGINFIFTFPKGVGNYRFYSIAVDNATNAEAAPVTNDTICGYDNQKPVSSVDIIFPYNVTSSTRTINATASDDISGVKNVTLYYRFSNSNASWNGWVNAGIDIVSPWSWSFSFNNGTGYYQFYSISNDNAENQENAPGTADTSCHYILTHTPTVTTNVSTGIKETNATLRGYLINDGNDTTTCGFWYDIDSGIPYAKNQTVGLVLEGNAFIYNASGLVPGQLYYFRAWAYNSKGFNGTSNEVKLLTKPVAPAKASFKVQTNSSTKIYLTWTKGIGANTTYIERNTTSGWTRGQGTMIYNGSGSNYEDAGLTPGTTYYYQAWSFAKWNPIQWSDGNTSGGNTTKYVPVLSNEQPANKSIDTRLSPTISINVNHGNGYRMNITWYWGTDSSCPNLIGINKSINNGTYQQNNDNNFSSNSKTYYWKIIVNDEYGGWANATYHFRTNGYNKEIISKERNAYALEISADGKTVYGIINNTNVTTSTDTNWHYVVLTYDGTTIKLYEDGKLKNSTTLIGNIPTNNNDLMLGDRLTGTLDELRISSITRSPTWINTTYKMTSSPASFIKVEAEQNQQHTYLNITIENTGSTTIKTQDCTLLINGTKTSFICIQPCIYPLKETNVFANVTAVGSKRNKFITGNGIIDYEGYG